MHTYLKVEISAETRDQADAILNELLAQRLVTGGQIIEAPARFLWKNDINDLNYFTITSFTVARNKELIIDEVNKVSVEEVPMVIFLPFDGNKKVLDWIDHTVS